VLYADKEAAQFFDGIGVHWYEPEPEPAPQPEPEPEPEP